MKKESKNFIDMLKKMPIIYYIPMGLVLVAAIILLILITPKKTENDIYREEVNQFYGRIQELSISINAIDKTSATAPEDLLVCLDQLNANFQEFALVPIPADYAQNEILCQNATEHMLQAVTLYHEIFAENGYDAEKAQQADIHYQNAFRYINALGQSLMGYELVE